MKRAILLPLVAGVCISSFAFAVPALVPYTGTLRFEGGGLYQGSVTAQVQLFGTDVGGIPLWSEDLGTLPVHWGAFQALLGTIDPEGLGESLVASDTLFLQFTLNSPSTAR